MALVMDKKTGHYTMTDDEKKSILDSSEKEYHNSLNITRDIRKRWWLVERYLEGSQWSQTGSNWSFLSTANNALLNNNALEVNVDENIVVDNVMLRIHMTNVARLCRYKPQLEIAPNEKSKENNIAVRKGRVALYDLLHKSNWIRLQQTHARHLNVMGLTFLKVAYDPSAGRQVKWPVLDENGEPALDERGRPVYKKSPEGEVKLFGVNPKNVQFPDNSTCIQDADWMQESNVRSTDYVKRKWKISVKPESITAFEQERAGLGGGTSDTKQSEQISNNSVIVKERWYRPCAKYPQGAIVVWVKERLLECKSLLKWYPDLPYFAAWNIFNDESIYSDAPAYHLIPHQNEVNRSESNIARHVNLVGKPKLLQHKDAQISDKAWTTDTGEIVEHSAPAGTKPAEWLLAPNVSPSVLEHVDRHLNRMMMIGYAQDIMRPSHTRSGNAIAYEQEIDENTMAPMISSMTDMMERGLAFALELMARYYKVPRMVKMLDSNAWTIENEFLGSDLFGNFDVRVNFLAGLPSNKLAKQQFIIQMYEKKLISQPLAQKYLELGEAEDALHEQALEAEVVEAIVKAMEQRHTIPFHEWDNHPLMILGIEGWLKENFMDAPPELIQKFEQKRKMHVEWMQLQAHPANAADGGAAGAGAEMEALAGGEAARAGLEAGPEAPELGGAESVQEGSSQPNPEEVLQSGAEGV